MKFEGVVKFINVDRIKLSKILALPLTSSVYSGLDVLIPTLPSRKIKLFVPLLFESRRY